MISVTTRRITLSAAALAGALILTACGGNTSTGGHDMSTMNSPAASAPATPGAQFNDADVTFAQMMIPHHQEALNMAKLATTRASDPEVKKLAAQIEAAQTPEIEQMTRWLTAWGKPISTGMGHDMPGAMSHEDMVKLEAATGQAFDTQFLRMMIVHHDGAIQMAKEEQAKGTNPEAKKLAEDIIRGQSAEIARMRQLLGTS
jgi:uncharacterized protein (DUF305 family)